MLSLDGRKEEWHSESDEMRLVRRECDLRASRVGVRVCVTCRSPACFALDVCLFGWRLPSFEATRESLQPQSSPQTLAPRSVEVAPNDCNVRTGNGQER